MSTRNKTNTHTETPYEAFKKSQRSWMISAVIIIAVALFMGFGRGKGAVDFSSSDESISLSAGEEGQKYTLTVRYDETKSFTFVEDLDLGTMVEGQDTDKYKTGTWENDSYGTYLLCANGDVKCYVVAEMTDGTYKVFNYESADTTENLAPALQEELERQKAE